MTFDLGCRDEFPCLLRLPGTNLYQSADPPIAIQHLVDCSAKPLPGIIADLASRDKEADRATTGVRDSIQLGVSAALGLPNQTPTPPFFNRRLEAARGALR